MSNHHHSFLRFQQIDDSLFNGQFILDVQGCRGLIQQQDRTVFQNSPGDREALPLTTGEQVAVLAGGVS